MFTYDAHGQTAVALLEAHTRIEKLEAALLEATRPNGPATLEWRQMVDDLRKDNAILEARIDKACAALGGGMA